MNKIDPALWSKFITFGSGWTLEADRLYDEKGKPLYYHLHMYGLAYPDGYSIDGYDINELVKQAIKDGKEGLINLNNIIEK